MTHRLCRAFVIGATMLAGLLAPGATATTKAPSVVTMHMSPNRKGVIVVGQPVVLAGSVATAKGVATPTGTVRIAIGGVVSRDGPNAVLDRTGAFTLPDFTLPADGPYPIDIGISYSGDGSYTSGTSSTSELTAYESDTVTTLTQSRMPASPGQSVTFTAVVTPVSAIGSPIGDVWFTVDGSPASGLVPLSRTGSASWSGVLGVGSHQVAATYVPNGSPFTTSRAQVTQVVSPSTSKVDAALTVLFAPLAGSTFGVRFSGALQPPAGVNAGDACSGAISVVLAQDANRATGATSLDRDCRYSVSVSFPATARLTTDGIVSSTLTYSGNDHIKDSTIAMPMYDLKEPTPPSSDSALGPDCTNWHVPGCFSTPWIVTLGDSYIAGEGGRWGANSDVSTGSNVYVGSHAYDDNKTNNIATAPGHPVPGTSELLPGCHRSSSAEAFIGTGGVKSLDLACSGAATYSYTSAPSLFTSAHFKPGIDATGTGGQRSQDLLLSAFASNTSRHVKMVVIGIGGNDYGFGDILSGCLSDYLRSHNLTDQQRHFRGYWNSLFDNGFHWVYDDPVDHRSYCKDDLNATVQALHPAVQAHVTASIRNVAQALATQGYGRNDYTIMVQTVPTPVATSATTRYGEGPTWNLLDPSTWNIYPSTSKPRQYTGGCGFWNKDLDWIHSTVVPLFNNTIKAALFDASNLSVTGANGATYMPRIKLLDVQEAFQGHRLCQGPTPPDMNPDILHAGTHWGPSQVDTSEWVTQLRTVSTITGPYELQEDFHPDYWGQLALRSCVRLVYNHGSPKSGTCARAGAGVDTTYHPAEPKMGIS